MWLKETDEGKCISPYGGAIYILNTYCYIMYYNVTNI